MVKTCLDCKECKKVRSSYICIAEDDRVKLPAQNFIHPIDCDNFLEG